MRIGGLSHWIPLLARYSAGQLLILVINLITGFLILRFLSISEYAIYILASLLQTVGSLGTDLGMSQGVVSLGAPIREDKAAFGSLVRSAMRLRRKLFLAVVPIVLVIAYMLLHGNESRIEIAIAVTVLALAIAWVQQSGSIATAALNANHDSSGLLRAGVGSGIVRLILVAIVCSSAPYAVAAMVINLVGAVVNSGMLWRRCGQYLGIIGQEMQDNSDKLASFMKPLLPGIIYYLVQGHVSTFVLALAGTTVAVAEVGALGRLGQIIGVLTLLNGFFVQPYFARVTDRARFANRAGQMALILGLGFAIVTASSILAPGAWLLVLGPQYDGLTSELTIALLGAQLSVAGAILYTIVIATGRTRGQWLQIAMGVGAQLTFLAIFDVKGTREALVLNLLPAATYAVLQCGLLIHVLVTWNRNARTS